MYKLIGIVSCLFLFTFGTSAPEANRIYWKERSLLTLADFKSVKTAPDGSGYKALSQLGISYNYSENTGAIHFKIESFFNKDKSWILKDASNDSILLHEQIHFAVCELHARYLRKKASQTKFAAGKVGPTLEKLYKDEMAAYRKEQQQYDADTNHSINRKEQHEWEQKITAKIAESAKWEATEIDLR